MQQSINELRVQFDQEILNIQTSNELEGLKVKFLGKKGPIQQLMAKLRDVPPAEKREVGQHINDLKNWMEKLCEEKGLKIIAKEEADRLASETLDITLPGRHGYVGRAHPLSKAMEEIIDILSSMGFSVQYGPEVDTDYYNFEVLNFAADHSARDMQDTFYISPHVLLRTHTSNIQARVMETNQPPIRIIAPGKVYRNEAITARSHVFFHQVEAVYIDKNVTFADLLGTLDVFLNRLFKTKVQTRYRPSYFPFVEPGMEVDVGCLACEQKGCALCKHTGWLEIAGAGMIHPEVLRNGGIDPEKYTGFAWGMGLERLVILMRGIQDIRQFTENDCRFLNQFTSV